MPNKNLCAGTPLLSHSTFLNLETDSLEREKITTYDGGNIEEVLEIVPKYIPYDNRKTYFENLKHVV